MRSPLVWFLSYEAQRALFEFPAIRHTIYCRQEYARNFLTMLKTKSIHDNPLMTFVDSSRFQGEKLKNCSVCTLKEEIRNESSQAPNSKSVNSARHVQSYLLLLLYKRKKTAQYEHVEFPYYLFVTGCWKNKPKGGLRCP